jgi:hypothetical protein
METATALLGLLLAAWGVYLARRNAFPKKTLTLPECHFGRPVLSKKMLSIVDDAVRKALSRSRVIKKTAHLYKNILFGDISYSW